MILARKSQALLAYLAIKPGRSHSRDKLTALLWGDSGDARARQSLRQAVSGLRSALRPATPLRSEGETIWLDASQLDVDVGAFERLAAEGTPEALRKAVELYEGDLLEGQSVKDAAFDEWLMVERERLRELAVEVTARLLAHQMKTRADDHAIQTAVRLLALDPLQEPVHRAVMRLYERHGRRGAALRQYQVCVSLLQRELGVEPDVETQQLYRTILQRQRAVGRASSATMATPELGMTGKPPVGATARLHVAGVAHDAPLVGRQAELARLQDVLGKLGQGQGQRLLVLGEAGVGKTRLLELLVASARQQGYATLIGGCDASEQLLPFRPWVDVFRDAGVMDDAETLQALSPVWRRELARLFPDLGDAPALMPNRPEDHVRLLEAMAALLERLAIRQPIVLVLEDLQWADEMTLRLFAFLGRRVDRLPVLLVGSAREEDVPDSPLLIALTADLDRTGQTMAVTPLSPPETSKLILALMHARADRAWIDRVTPEVWALSGGNAFVIVETTRALHDDGAADAAVGLPRRVHDLIEARLARLGEPGRRLVAAAAVVGEASSFRLLARAAGLADDEAAGAMEQLVRRRVLAAVGEGFDFTHHRLREVAYAGLLDPARRSLHAAIAAALESGEFGAVEEIEDRLARHFARAGQGEGAVTYLIRLGERAARRYALEDAVRFTQEAHAHAERLPADRRDRRVLQVLMALCSPLYLLGRYREILERLLAESARVERLADSALSAAYHFWLGHAHGLLGDASLAAVSEARAIEEAARCGDAITQGKAHYVLAREGFWSGHLGEGIEHGQQAVALLEGTAEYWWLGQAHWALGVNHAFRGDFGLALQAYARAQDIGARIGDPRLQGFSQWSAGWVHALRRDWAVAIPACRDSVERSHDPLDTALAHAHLGAVFVEKGDPGQAIPLLQQSIDELRRLGMRKSEGRVTMWLGEAYRLSGRLPDALGAARHALQVTAQANHRLGFGESCRVLGRVLSARGETAEGETWLQQALRTFESIDARFETARTHLILAAVSTRPDAQEAHHAEAIELFDALGVDL